MPNGKPSRTSRDLANVRLQLRSGKTRSQNPRDLTQEEIDALTQKRDALLAEMAARSKERVVNRINGHVTSEADRIIESQKQTNSSVAALDALFLRGELPARAGQSDAERLAQIRQAKASLQTQERSLRERLKVEKDKRKAEAGVCKAVLRCGKRKGKECGVRGCKKHRVTMEAQEPTAPAPTLDTPEG